MGNSNSNQRPSAFHDGELDVAQGFNGRGRPRSLDLPDIIGPWNETLLNPTPLALAAAHSPPQAVNSIIKDFALLGNRTVENNTAQDVLIQHPIPSLSIPPGSPLQVGEYLKVTVMSILPSPHKEDAQTKLEPITLTWNGRGKVVYLAMAGDDDWKGRKLLVQEYDFFLAQLSSLFILIMQSGDSSPFNHYPSAPWNPPLPFPCR
jgi:hypothetical protein